MQAADWRRWRGERGGDGRWRDRRPRRSEIDRPEGFVVGPGAASESEEGGAERAARSGADAREEHYAVPDRAQELAEFPRELQRRRIDGVGRGDRCAEDVAQYGWNRSGELDQRDHYPLFHSHRRRSGGEQVGRIAKWGGAIDAHDNRAQPLLYGARNFDRQRDRRGSERDSGQRFNHRR